MNDHPAPSPKWRKSTYSTSSNNCVEVAATSAGIMVRDSKDPAGPALTFTPRSWAAFVQEISAGATD